MEVYAGLDLHSTNTYVAMIDKDNKVLYKQRHGNDVPTILSVLDPFKKDIQGVVVESTYNWYWLVDALMDAGYRVHLANVSAIKQYEGLKQIDDRRSSLWLANLLTLKHPAHGLYLSKGRAPHQGSSPEEAPSCPAPDITHLERQEYPCQKPRHQDEKRGGEETEHL
jgi:transposase